MAAKLGDWVKKVEGSLGGAQSTAQAEIRDLLLDFEVGNTRLLATAALTDIVAKPFWKNRYTTDCQVLSVSFLPNTTLTADSAEYVTLAVTKGAGAGASATTVASRATDTGTTDDMAALTDWALTLSGTAADLIVASGEELAFASTNTGTTGVALPAGRISVKLRKL